VRLTRNQETESESSVTNLPESIEGKTVAVLGGTGAQGRGLARRFATAGIPVVIGSRGAERAQQAATELSEVLGVRIDGASNRDAAQAGHIVVVAVPWDGHEALLIELAPQLGGKVVVDCVNPLGFDKQGPYALDVEDGSAAEQAQRILTDAIVVGAFHNVSAVKLEDADTASIDTDALVLGDDRAATALVQDLVGVIPGMRGVYAGRLRNSRQVESLTANLIAINRRYKSHAGIRITDI
jgi:NADPH-dependent F420 reductase